MGLGGLSQAGSRPSFLEMKSVPGGLSKPRHAFLPPLLFLLFPTSIYTYFSGTLTVHVNIEFLLNSPKVRPCAI
jgi:hypothetical protein